jgi:hypothetical protein
MTTNIELIEIIENVVKDFYKIDEFTNKEYFTYKESLKIKHRMIDKLDKVLEYYQEELEEEINKL